VQSISNSLSGGASMDPIVLIERQDQSQYKYDIADGWHRTLGAEDAGWPDVPAFIGEGFDDKTDWGLEMQNESDSVKKAALAEVAVLRRYLRRGGDVTKFVTTALDTDTMMLLRAEIAMAGRDLALDHARDRVFKQKGNAQGLIDWYNSGADGAIDWGSDGDWYACVNVASNYMDDDQAKGFCTERHLDVLGVAPGRED
jgi:hypothetical protein